MLPDADRVVCGIFEVVSANPGEQPVVAAQAGELVVDSVLNTYRHDVNPPSLPTLNDVRVRDVSSKRRGYTGILRDMSPRTMVVTRDHPLEAVAERFLPAAELIVKPANGMRGQGVLPITAAALSEELHSRFAASPDAEQVVQERIMARPWPASIHAAHLIEEERLRGAKRQELRLFLVNDQVVPIARIVSQADERDVHHAGDSYVALNPYTIPDSVYTRGEEVRQRIERATGVSEMAIAVDLIYGVSPMSGDDQPDWYISEVNSVDPQFPALHQYPTIAGPLHDARSDQLLRMAA